MNTLNKLWIGLIILALLSPLGLLLPEHFKSGDAWGEWGIDTVNELVGYIPQGLERLSTLWNAPMPDYSFKNWEEKSSLYLSASYIISAIIGITLAAILVTAIGKLLVKKDD